MSCGTELLLNGDAGELIVWPGEDTLSRFQSVLTVTVKTTEPVEPVVEPSPPEPTPTLDVTEVSSAVEPSGGSAVAGWATLGAGSALAIAGVVVVVVGESRFERIQAGVSPDGTLQKLSGAEESRLRSEGRLMRGLGWTGVAVGLGAAATGLLVALMVDDDEIDARPSAEVGAALTPRGGGVLVRGAF